MQRAVRFLPRIYVECRLHIGQTVAITLEQAHYLTNVMRLKAGDPLRLFNGRDGEWEGGINHVSKKSIEITIHEQLRPQKAEPDLWLCCAPIKKAHFDYMIEKGTELGIAVLQPILTERTQIRAVNVERCGAIAVESAEQSERLHVPEIRKPISLTDLLSHWPKDRALIVCAEWGDATPVEAALALPAVKAATQAAVLVGPEGGFSAEEFEALREIPSAVFVRLGYRILRADTAAIAALSCWQALRGDWN